MPNVGCREIAPDKASLVVIECNQCKLHLGIDETWLEQRGDPHMQCSACCNPLTIEGIE